MKMVLKVEGKSFEETRPILGTNENPEKDDLDLKVQDGYKHITSSMILDPAKPDKPEVALERFFTSVKMQDISLAKQCLEITNRQLNKYNALNILQHISRNTTIESNTDQTLDLAPSAPPIDSDNQANEDWVQDLIDNLRNNCLLEIDKNADFILKQRDFLDLSYEDVRSITTRDSLGVSSEMVVYSAVMKWAMEECHRRKQQVQKVNLKAVLKDLVYAPRYGLLSKKEFLCRTIDGVKGPDRSGGLDEIEIERILNYIKKKGKHSPVTELPYKQSLPRRTSGEKSKSFHSGVSCDSICTSDSKCDKFVINFLTCWTAVFD